MNYIAKVYAKAIISESKTINDVPEQIKDDVLKWLKELAPAQNTQTL